MQNVCWQNGRNYWRKSYDEYSCLQKELEEASLDAKQQARELSFLQYEIDEIGQADLKPGEDEALEADFKRCLMVEKSRKPLRSVRNCVPKEMKMRQI